MMRMPERLDCPPKTELQPRKPGTFFPQIHNLQAQTPPQLTVSESSTAPVSSLWLPASEASASTCLPVSERSTANCVRVEYSCLSLSQVQLPVSESSTAPVSESSTDTFRLVKYRQLPTLSQVQLPVSKSSTATRLSRIQLPVSKPSTASKLPRSLTYYFSLVLLGPPVTVWLQVLFTRFLQAQFCMKQQTEHEALQT